MCHLHNYLHILVFLSVPLLQLECNLQQIRWSPKIREHDLIFWFRWVLLPLLQASFCWYAEHIRGWLMWKFKSHLCSFRLDKLYVPQCLLSKSNRWDVSNTFIKDCSFSPLSDWLTPAWSVRLTKQPVSEGLLSWKWICKGSDFLHLCFWVGCKISWNLQSWFQWTWWLQRF